MLFKAAYVRGVNQALIDTGAVKYASEELAAEVADTVAGNTEMAEPIESEVADDTTAELAAQLVDLSNALQESSESAAGAAETAAKSASAKNLEILRRKIAEGTTITGTNPMQANIPQLAETGEAKMDNQQRPEGYANVGEDAVGTQEASGAGAIGSETEIPGVGSGPVAAEGENTATEAVKGASLRNLIKKLAEGTTITGTDPSQENTQAQAAAATGEGQMDANRRPEGYAVKGETQVGQSDMAAAARAAAIGNESPHQGQEKNQGGTNTVIQQSKSAEDDAYMQQFRSLSAKYANRLPFFLDAGEKVAAIQYLMSQMPTDREALVIRMEKTAELPEGLKDYIESKKNGDKEESTKEKEEKKDKEKSEENEETKEASLRAGDILSELRRLQRK